MKKIISFIVNAVKVIILSIAGLFMLLYALIVNLINGVSPKVVFETLWLAIQVGKEEEGTES